MACPVRARNSAKVSASSGADPDPNRRMLRQSLSPQRANPIYHPEPKPFSERSPWLIYVVLAAASLALASILLSLARAAKAQPQV